MGSDTFLKLNFFQCPYYNTTNRLWMAHLTITVTY